MLKHEDDETTEQEARTWLEKMGFQYKSYGNLSASGKGVLHNLVCIPTHLTTYSERRDLYRKLCSPAGIAGRDSMVPVDSMTDDDLRDFFRPLTPSQAELPVDWGCNGEH